MKKTSQFETLCSAASQFDALRRMPLYYSGDDTFVMTAENTSLEDFLRIADDIKEGSAEEDIRESAIGENKFLYVGKDEGYEGAYYIPCRREVRMVKRLSGALVPQRLTDKDSFGSKKKLIQLCPDDNFGNFGMGYIISLGEGHFIIYDGNGDPGGMAEKILGYLLADTPEGQKPIIDAWFITHFHWDHVAAMFDFAKKYADRVEVRNLLANFPDLSAVYIKERGPNTEFYARWFPKILECFSTAKVWKLHTGQSYFVGDVRVEVLLTHEDVYPEKLRSNDTSTVTMMYINGKKIFFPGDIEYEKACKLIHDMYGSYLKSDYYQVSHHGWGSEALYFYDDVDAPVFLWPLRKRDWEIIQQFPATKRMTAEMNEGKREFLVTRDDDHILEF